MSDLVVLRRSEGPPLRLKARSCDVKRRSGPAGVVELTLWARDPVGWAVSAVRRQDGREVADAMLCEGYEDICDALEALAARGLTASVAAPKGGWTADSAADALVIRLSDMLGDAAFDALVGEALADWAVFAGAPDASERRRTPARRT